VVPFENRTGEPTLNPLGGIAADWITRGLTETGLADVVTPPSAANPPAEAQSPRRPAPAPTSTRGLRDVARAAGASIVVSGAFYRRGDSIEFTADITDATRGTLVTTAGPVRGPLAAPTQPLEALRARILGGIAIRIDAVLDQGHRVAQPPTYDAYREYVAGEQAWSAGDSRQSLVHLYRAAALDSTFAEPLVEAAATHQARDECATADSLGLALRAVPGRLSRFQALRLERTLARCRGAWMAAYRATIS
jgi:hypothetical protein